MKSLEERFWLKVRKENECWIWTAALLPNGYGRLGLGGRENGEEYAHRLSWVIHFGRIPDGLCVLHKCDVRNCVNPQHLFLGTLADNNRDTMKKGRLKKPEFRKSAKLSWDKVKVIRNARGIHSLHYLAKKFNVAVNCIYQVLHNVTWKEGSNGQGSKILAR